jgi:hypothetical protein
MANREVKSTIDVESGGLLLQTETSAGGNAHRLHEDRGAPFEWAQFCAACPVHSGVHAETPGSITVRRGCRCIGQQDSPFGSTGMSANGSCDMATRIFADGIEMMDYAAMTFSFSPSVDSLTEFKVETSTHSADLGGAPGGQVNRVTPAGCSFSPSKRQG